MGFWDQISKVGEGTGDLLGRIGNTVGSVVKGGVDVAVSATERVGDLVASDNPGTQAVVGLLLDRIGLGLKRDMGAERPEAGQGRIILYGQGSGSGYSATGSGGGYALPGGLSGGQVGMLAGLAALGVLGVVLIARR